MKTGRLATLAIIEDVGVTRAGLAVELSSAGFGVLPFADGQSCLARLAGDPADIAICDLYLSGESGPPSFETITGLIDHGARVVVYSTWALDPDVHTAIDTGVLAYVQKSSSVQPLITAIERVLDLPENSGPILTPEIAAAIRRRQRFGLTASELEVLTYVGQHLSNQEIAAVRSVTEETVKTQMASIRAKLGAKNRAAAVRLGHDHGLIGRWTRSGATT